MLVQIVTSFLPLLFLGSAAVNAQYYEGDFKCPERHGYFKYADQCSEYVECKNYVPLVFTCPAGLLFNPVAPWTDYPCEQPSKVQCHQKPKPRPAPVPATTTTTTSTTTTTTTTPAPTTTQAYRPGPKYVPTPRPAPMPSRFKCPQPHGYYKHADQCGSYVECKNFIPMTYTCPEGLHFNPSSPWTEYPCDHPARSQCYREPKVPPTTTSSTTTTTTTTTPAPTTTTVRTTERPAPITPRYDNPETEYECEEPNGYFPHTEQCGQYIECKNYVPLKYTCPVGLHFNPRSQWIDYPCAHPTEVQCNRRPPPPVQRPRPPTTTSTTTTTTTTPAPTTPVPTTPAVTSAPRYDMPEEEDYECSEPHGYFPHDECDEYVECKNYIPRVYECPVGLYFNPSAQWTEYPCDYPSRVQCNRKK